MKRNKRGITLIALIISIVVLVILAGIAINILYGENGIITKANLTGQMSKISNEKEAIQLDIALFNIEKTIDSSSEYNIGKKLYDKNLENGDKWNVVINNETLKTYGTGYSYVEEGSQIPDYGETKYKWILNYETGEVIQADGNYTELSYKDSLAVTDGLLFNIDATNVSDLESLVGDNTSLYYFDLNEYDTIGKRLEAYNEEKQYEDVTKFEGYDRRKSENLNEYVDLEKKAFKFEGNNYIEIYNNNGFDFSNGCTFEIYGNFNDTLYSTYKGQFTGFFSLWSGRYSSQCETRIGYLVGERKQLHYSLVFSGNIPEYVGSWSEAGARWNQQYRIENLLDSDNYLTLVFEIADENKVNQKIYMNGELLAIGDLNREYYNLFIKYAQNLKYMELGRSTMSSVSNWCYAKGDCYAIRIYNKALNDNEVAQNVNKTILYRQMVN